MMSRWILVAVLLLLGSVVALSGLVVGVSEEAGPANAARLLDASPGAVWWEYENTGMGHFLGVAPGDRLRAVEEDPGTITYSHVNRTQTPDYYVDQSRHRALAFNGEGYLVSINTSRVMQQEGLYPIGEATITTFHPPIPLDSLQRGSWSELVTEERRSIKWDDRGVYEDASSTTQVQHILTVDRPWYAFMGLGAVETEWQRGQEIRTYVWGDGWVVEEKSGSMALSLRDTNWVDSEGIPAWIGWVLGGFLAVASAVWFIRRRLLKPRTEIRQQLLYMYGEPRVSGEINRTQADSFRMGPIRWCG